MSYMNLNFSLLIAEDCTSTDPKVRNVDITRQYQRLLVSGENSKSIALAPGETKDIVSTIRSLGLDATTQLSISYPSAGVDTARLSWTGVGSNPVFRTKRALGIDATTSITISRVSPNSVRVQSVAGTPLSSVAVQIGDILKFERSTDTFTSPFSATNAGREFKVQATGVASIDVIDNGTMNLDATIILGVSFDQALRVFSIGPVKTGDTIVIDGSTVNYSNKGSFEVTGVSPEYIEFTNSYAVTETFINTDNLITIYDLLIGFLSLRAAAPVKIRLNGAGVFQVGMLDTQDAIFFGSIKAWHIEAINDSEADISVTFQTASMVG